MKNLYPSTEALTMKHPAAMQGVWLEFVIILGSFLFAENIIILYPKRQYDKIFAFEWLVYRSFLCRCREDFRPAVLVNCIQLQVKRRGA